MRAQSLRAGQVAMVNALGSGLLETRAFLAFLPRICEVLMGERLKLPNIATWWCGQSAERAYVLANADRMLIGPALSNRLPFEADGATVLIITHRPSVLNSVDKILVLREGRIAFDERIALPQPRRTGGPAFDALRVALLAELGVHEIA